MVLKLSFLTLNLGSQVCVYIDESSGHNDIFKGV